MESTVVKNELLVGGFLALAFLIGGVLATKRSRDRGLLDTQRVHFAVDHGSGLQKGAPVLMRGVEIGSVGDVKLTDGHKVDVTADIAPRFAGFVTADAVATVVEPPFLGSTRVELEPGKGKVAGAGSELTSRIDEGLMARITSLEGDVRQVIQEVEGVAAEARETLGEVRKVATGINEGKGIASRLIHDEQMAKDVKSIVADLKTIVEQIKEGEGAAALAINDAQVAKDLKASAADLRVVASRLEKGEGTLGRLSKDSELIDQSTGLVKDVRSSLAKLNELNDQARASMKKVETLLTSTELTVRRVHDLVGSADSVTQELAGTIKRVNEGKGTVAALLNDDSVYRETKSLLKELRESVEDLREQAPINSFLGVVFSAF